MKKTGKQWLTIIAVVLAVAVVLSVGFHFLKRWDEHRGTFEGDYSFDENVLDYKGAKYVPNEDIKTFLVMGLDKFKDSQSLESYNNNQQADFLLLVVMNDAEKTYSAIHINRDTMVPVDILGVAGERVDTVTKQIALSHIYGNGKEVSCRNTVDSVSRLLYGVKINHFISFTMDSVPILNDMVGGITVKVLDDFGDIDKSLIKGKTVTLKGEQALRYVRTRRGLEDSTNSTRMKRQQQYLTALSQRIEELLVKDETFAGQVMVKMADYIVCDRTANQLQEMFKKASTYKKTDIKEITGKSVLGEEFIEFYPDEDKLRDLVVETFYIPK